MNIELNHNDYDNFHLAELKENENSSLNINSENIEKVIDDIVLDTNKKFKSNENKFMNITLYSIQQNTKNIDNQMDLENIQFSIIVKLEDILVNCNFNSNITDNFIEVHYIFNIIHILNNQIFNPIENNIYSFQHNFYLNDKNINIFDFIFENDIAIFIDNNLNNININNNKFLSIEKLQSSNNINESCNILNELPNNPDETINILYFHIEKLPDDFELSKIERDNIENIDSIYFALYKIQNMQLFNKINFFISIIYQFKNDDFFKYLFFNKFNYIFKFEIVNTKLIEFKENCLIEGEKINEILNDLKLILDENIDNKILINYINFYLNLFFDE